MSGVAAQIIAPLPPQPQRPVDPMRLLELRARVMAAIADIDRALVEMRSRSIERRSAVPAPPEDRPPPGKPIEYSGGYVGSGSPMAATAGRSEGDDAGWGTAVAARRRLLPRRWPTTSEKGYGAEHRRLCEQTKKLSTPAAPCAGDVGYSSCPAKPGTLDTTTPQRPRRSASIADPSTAPLPLGRGLIKSSAAPGSGHPLVLEPQHPRERWPSLTRGNEGKATGPSDRGQRWTESQLSRLVGD